MYKSSEENEKPENIINRMISKLKMAKRSQMQGTSINEMEDSEKLSSNNSEINRLVSHKNEKEEKQNDEENRRISVHNLSIFCDQLQKFIQYLQSIHHLQFLTYDYPKLLTERFETNVLELDGMLKEINAALININKQKAQQRCVDREMAEVKKSLNRIKDDEFREMEKVVALYDKALFTRWESAKTTHKPEVLMTLMTDIKCKQLALKNLDTLVMRKLGHLKTFTPVIAGEHEKSDTSKAVIPLPLFSFCPSPNERKSKIPLPPPLPPPPSLTSRIKARKLATPRRGRLRRDEEISDNFLETDLVDRLTIPLTFNGNDNLVVNFNGNSPHELTSMSTNSSNSTRSQDELTTSLQEEIDRMIQSLFGYSRDESEPENRTDVSSTKMDKNIELRASRDSEA